MRPETAWRMFLKIKRRYRDAMLFGSTLLSAYLAPPRRNIHDIDIISDKLKQRRRKPRGYQVMPSGFYYSGHVFIYPRFSKIVAAATSVFNSSKHLEDVRRIAKTVEYLRRKDPWLAENYLDEIADEMRRDLEYVRDLWKDPRRVEEWRDFYERILLGLTHHRSRYIRKLAKELLKRLKSFSL